jgi:hypothetical protein
VEDRYQSVLNSIKNIDYKSDKLLTEEQKIERD